MKADKGNKLVILDKTAYYERVNNMLASGPYVIFSRNPLPKKISKVRNILKQTPQLKQSLQISNPIIFKLYCIPKIHKPENSMRPIVSAMEAPTYNLAKWLTKKIEVLSIAESSFEANTL